MFRSVVIEKYRQRHGEAPKESQLRRGLRAFQARTMKLTKDVLLRFASGGPNIICFDPEWDDGRHIEITPYGWNADRNYIDTVLPETATPQVEVRPAIEEPQDAQSALIRTPQTSAPGK